ncbi:universal stress protein [Aliiroseovarius sp. YM-037]|uniref:universal stress protein n=1 Tax=Aliiroseovarius sp. YM-037 TaxID=3341728 RepID=UPI003A80A90D
MSKSVLCAVDITQPEMARRVLHQATRLADLDEAHVDVITVVPDFGMSVVGSYFDEDHTDKAVDGAREALNDLVTEEIGAEANKSVRHIVAVGTAYDVILATAKKAGSDLIVIGAHQPELSDYLLGPNAARVVRHSDCSVYVVR